MKFGYHTLWKWKEPFSITIDQISMAGFRGVETHFDDVFPYFNDRKKFVNMMSEREMTLTSIYAASYWWGWLKWSWWRFHWWRYRRRWLRLVKFAAYVGCDRIVLGGHQYYLKTKGQIKEKECLNIASLLNKVGKTCDDYGIKATYHPNKSDMAKRGDFVEKICDLTDPDLVDLTMDTGHLIAGGADLVQALRRYRERVNLVHFKDFKNGQLVSFGEGTINFPMILDLLKSIGYNDWVIIDDEPTTRTM
ncbi:MAG TPA: TIM barrel protein, partial [Candidatus Bathyarchaeia archaeon]